MRLALLANGRGPAVRQDAAGTHPTEVWNQAARHLHAAGVAGAAASELQQAADLHLPGRRQLDHGALRRVKQRLYLLLLVRLLLQLPLLRAQLLPVLLLLLLVLLLLQLLWRAAAGAAGAAGAGRRVLRRRGRPLRQPLLLLRLLVQQELVQVLLLVQLLGQVVAAGSYELAALPAAEAAKVLEAAAVKLWRQLRRQVRRGSWRQPHVGPCNLVLQRPGCRETGRQVQRRRVPLRQSLLLEGKLLLQLLLMLLPQSAGRRLLRLHREQPMRRLLLVAPATAEGRRYCAARRRQAGHQPALRRAAARGAAVRGAIVR